MSLLYGQLNRLYHDPIKSSLACIVFLIEGYGTLEYVFIANFLINRVEILIRKLNYIFVSWITAVKNRKQRFAG